MRCREHGRWQTAESNRRQLQTSYGYMEATLTCTDVQANGAGTLRHLTAPYGTLRHLTAAYGSLRQLTATLKPGLMAKAASGTLKNGFHLKWNGCGTPVPTVQASGTSSLRHLTATLKTRLNGWDCQWHFEKWFAFKVKWLRHTCTDGAGKWYRQLMAP